MVGLKMSDLHDQFRKVIGDEEFCVQPQCQAQLDRLLALDDVRAVRDRWVAQFKHADLLRKVIVTERLQHHYELSYFADNLAVSPFEGKLCFDVSERLLGGLYFADLGVPRPHNCGQVVLYERLGAVLLPARGYDPEDVQLVASAITEIKLAADYYSLRLHANSTIPGPGGVTPSQILDQNGDS